VKQETPGSQRNRKNCSDSIFSFCFLEGFESDIIFFLSDLLQKHKSLARARDLSILNIIHTMKPGGGQSLLPEARMFMVFLFGV
jgi:hypothetical protein